MSLIARQNLKRSIFALGFLKRSSYVSFLLQPTKQFLQLDFDGFNCFGQCKSWRPSGHYSNSFHLYPVPFEAPPGAACFCGLAFFCTVLMQISLSALQPEKIASPIRCSAYNSFFIIYHSGFSQPGLNSGNCLMRLINHPFYSQYSLFLTFPFLLSEEEPEQLHKMSQVTEMQKAFSILLTLKRSISIIFFVLSKIFSVCFIVGTILGALTVAVNSSGKPLPYISSTQVGKWGNRQ